MDGRTHSVAGFVYPPPTMEDTMDAAFQSQIYPQFDDGHLRHTMSSFYDPRLQSASPGASHALWEPPQVKRFLTEDQTTAYFNTPPYTSVVDTTMGARSLLGAHPLPAQGQFRATSPLSSIDYSMAVPSPTPDRDSFYDTTNLPTTPSDRAVMSPSLPPIAEEPFSSQARTLQFFNMGPAVPAAYVNPVDVDPSRQLGYFEPDAGQHEFTFAPRGYSFESGSSHQELDQAQHQITVAFRHQRVATPEDMLDSIVARPETEGISHYPPLPGQGANSVVEGNAGTSHGRGPMSKRKKDEGAGALPSKKQRTGTTATRKTRPKQPRASGVSPPKGRSKVAPSGLSPKTAMTSPPPVATSRTSHACPHCDHAPFKDASTLESHVKKQHTRPYICIFHLAGCPSTFASKNEWKRHCKTQHAVLEYWHCTENECAQQTNPPSAAATRSTSSSSRSKSSRTNPPSALGAMCTNGLNSVLPTSSPSLPTHGSIFNRKDLFTQHYKRMHMPPTTRKAIARHEAQQQQQHQQQHPTRRSKKSSPSSSSTSTATATASHNRTDLDISKAWEARLHQAQERSRRQGVTLPTHMRCPAAGCGEAFDGDEALDAWMEHVARHLESGDRGPVAFGCGGVGGAVDTLTDWAAREDVRIVRADGRGGWVLLGGLKKGRTVVVKEEEVEVVEEVVEEVVFVGGGEDGERDAYGEDEEEM